MKQFTEMARQTRHPEYSARLDDNGAAVIKVEQPDDRLITIYITATPTGAYREVSVARFGTTEEVMPLVKYPASSIKSARKIADTQACLLLAWIEMKAEQHPKH